MVGAAGLWVRRVLAVVVGAAVPGAGAGGVRADGARTAAGGLTESEKHRLAWNFRYRQPREVLGLAENTEPTDFAWDVILWLPPPARRPGIGAAR